MKTRSKILFFLSFLFVSCVENSNQNEQLIVSNLESESQKVEVYTKNSEYFNITSDFSDTLRGREGTLIIIGEGAFKKNEKLRVELKEYYSFSDMLLDNISTCSDERIIDTKGMIFLDIRDLNGNEIEIDYSKIKLSFPSIIEDQEVSPTDSIYRIFNCQPSAGKEFNWVPNYESIYPVATFHRNDSVYRYRYLNLFSLESLGWINCDKFIDYKESTNLSVDLADGVNKFGSDYNLLLDEYNSIVNGKLNKSGQVEFSNLPSNQNASLIAIGSDGKKKMYYAILDLNTNDKNLKFPKLVEIDQSELSKILNERFGGVIGK